MKLSLGIVGLPNVGKSTLFNALTKQQVLAENYPFATIDPNIGVVPVYDERLLKVAGIEQPERITNATVEFVDIAGLVKGAAEGQGLGNKFLANIRETNAIVQVVRAFNDSRITHVEESVDPARDIELIQTELIIKDIESIDKKLKEYKAKARSDKKFEIALNHVEALLEHLNSGKMANQIQKPIDEEALKIRRDLFLLTDKPVIYLFNATEDQLEDLDRKAKELVGDNPYLTLDIKLEAEIADMDEADKTEFMKDLGIEMTGLERLTKEAYDILGLISFFTSGPKETRAWTIRNGEKAKQAAKAIHNDISDNFIAADVVTWEDFVATGGWQGAKESGKQRLEGKDYVVKDGDVILFKHNG